MNNTTKRLDFVFRIAFLFIYATTLFIPLQTTGAAPATPVQETPTASKPSAQDAGIFARLAQALISAPPSSESKSAPIYISPPITVNSGENASIQKPPVAPSTIIQPYVVPTLYPKSATNGNLSITPITAYNVIVDSNLLTPASFGPSAATVGAQFCNTSGSAMTDVWAYTGNFDANNNGTLNEAGDKTPGVYPQRTPATVAAAENPALAGMTMTDYGDTTRVFSLKQESGSLAPATDASRYIGTLAAGECKTQYWLISYPRIACISATPCVYNSPSATNVTGGIKPDDDLWLPYFFWATSSTTGATPSYYWNPLTMRNEISAMANKIWPNGDNKVPPQYIAAIQDVLGWNTWVPGGGTVAYPGQTATSQGIWYDFGVVGAGFDNNFDLVPDRNAWVQPIGDAGSYDPGCFRLVRTYGLIIVKLNDGTEQLIPFVDRMYFENVPANNTGAVGLVYYEYAAMDGACSAGLTPYQEVASGFDNEKFNADFGAGIPPLQSQQTTLTYDKNGQTSIALGGMINYTLTFTLPDANTGDSTTTISVGTPSLGAPLVYFETVPAGLQFVSNSASATATMANPAGSEPLTVLASKDSGTTWYNLGVAADQTAFCSPSSWPCNKDSSASPNQILIQWRLTNSITSPATGSPTTGQVSFNAIVPLTSTAKAVDNTSCLKIGNGPNIVCDTHKTVITGTSAIVGTVWKDDGVSSGVSGNGALDETIPAAAIPSVTVKLYWDNNGNGVYTDAGDFLYATTTSDANGGYCFDGTPGNGTCTTGAGGLPDANAAPAGSPRYIIVVDSTDPDIPVGYGPSTTTSYTKVALPAATVYGDTQATEPSNFGFTPALSVVKRIDTPTTVVGGAPVNFTLTVSNTLPGGGAGGAACVYNTYATSEGSQSTGVADNLRFDDTFPRVTPMTTANVFTAPEPDGLYSVSSYSASGVQVLDGVGIAMGQQSGNITNVKARVKLYISNLFDDGVVPATTSDYGGIEYWAGAGPTQYTSTPVGTQAQQNATTTILQTHVGLANAGWYELDLGAINAATGFAWTWADLAAGNTIHIVYRAGKQGVGDSVYLYIDAIGLQVATDGTCGSAATTLNPVPFDDKFDNSYLTFVSSNPPIDSSSVSGTVTTLHWNNMGPLYPGQSKDIVVTYTAKVVTSNTTTINYDQSTGAKFASGASANSDLYAEANNQASVTITPSGSIAGVVWADVDNSGWTAGATGYNAGDTFIQGVNVKIYACEWDNGSGNITSTDLNYLTTKTCTGQKNGGVTGRWTLTPVQTITTDATGAYLFDNLALGFYYVQVDSATLPTGFTTQNAEPLPNGTGQTCAACNNIWESTGVVGTYNTANMTTTNFNELTGGEHITNVNFGYKGNPLISGVVWQDYNGDGTRATTDAGITTVTVNLRNCGVDNICGNGDDPAIVTTTTDATGYYEFANLTAGRTYEVFVTTATLPTTGSPTWAQTDEDKNGVNDSPYKDNLVSFATVVANTAYVKNDFGFHRANAYVIGDTLFYDWDGDGVQDSTFAAGGIDEGMSLVDVQLYEDLNNNGVIDPADPLVGTIPTDVNGQYCFGGSMVAGTCTPSSATTALATGNYIVKVNTADPQFPTNVSETKDPTESGVCVVCDSKNALSIVAASNFLQDFGYKPTGSGTIGDTVFKDMNGNGTQDSAEVGISGVTVELQVDLNGDGTWVVIKTAVTDSSGKYLFSGLPAGTYRVNVKTDTTYGNSTAIPNDTLGNDYKPTNGTVSGANVYMTKTLATNASNDLTADFGFGPPASIGDTVYNDVNGNGTQDPGEPGISGVTVTLYSFTDAGNGTAGYQAGDVFFDKAGGTPNVYDVGEPYYDRDGRYQVGNGGSGDTLGAAITTAVTDANGHYQFANLSPGYYVVGVTSGLPGGISPTDRAYLSGDPSTDGFSCLTSAPNPLNNPADTGEPNSLVCDAKDGQHLYAGTNYIGADFGYKLPGSVGDTVWIDTNSDGIRNYLDANANGVQDLNEPFTEAGIPNITVTLLNCGADTICGNGDDLAPVTTSTNIDGGYSFNGLANATYRITVDTADTDWPSGLPTTPVYDPDGTNNSQTLVVVSGGAVTSVGGCSTLPNGCDPAGDSDSLNLDADFGYKFSGTASLSGTICLETTVDGFCGATNTTNSGVGAGETAYNSATVYLYKWTDAGAMNGLVDPGETVQIATTTTNASGDYSFANLPNGVFYVVAIGAPQTGLDLTTTAATTNAGGGGTTTQLNETLAGDGTTLSAYQVVNMTTDTAVVDRDFAFQSVGAYDYGDLPQSYSTLLAGTPDGARALIPLTPTLYFGSAATQAELIANGIPATNASSDTKEDGVSVPAGGLNTSWNDGDGGTLSVTVVGTGWLVGWIDINKDGDFADANEMVLNRSVTSGTITPTITQLSGLADGNYYARFRLFPTQPAVSALAYSGATTNGEVEDYRFAVNAGVPTPVTVSYFHAQRMGSKINFDWSTATETGNVGFNLYVEDKNGGLVKINTDLIPSKTIDSLNQQDYSFSIDMAGETFYIEDVGALGENTQHGPYQIGETYGERSGADKIDQATITAEHAQSVANNQNEIKRGMKVPVAALQTANLQTTSNPVPQLTTTLNLKVRQTGLYRVTYEALKAAGLDLLGVPTPKITLANRGQTVPIYIETPRNARIGDKFGPGGFIEFYGEALNTTYTDANVYTVQINKSATVRIPTNNAAPSKGAVPLTAFTDTLITQNQRMYANYAPGNDPWYDTSMLTYTTPKSWSFPFQINGLASSAATAQTLELVVWGVTDWPAAIDHRLQVSVNGASVANETFNGLVEKTVKVALPAGTLQEGANTLQLTLPGDTGVNWDIINLDKFSVSYPRSFQAQNGRLAFTAVGKSFTVANLPSKNVVVYRMDKKGMARLGGVRIQATGAAFSATFAGTNDNTKYLVTTVEALYAPTLEATRLAANLNRPAQYLIISHPDFIAGLQPLIQARQAQGLTVSVVDVNDLYAQYNYGVFDPQAIKKYIAYAAKNLGTQYVLLVGGDTYDYRNYLGKNSVSFIPSLYITTGPYAKFVPVDPLYADLNADNIPDLAIGRFPVRTQAELNLIINKTLAYAAKDYGRTAIFAADKDDGVVSFKNAVISLSAGLPTGWSSNNIYLDDVSLATAQTQLLTTMNNGVSLVTFAGHSGPTKWTLGSLFNTQQAANLTNAGRPFVAVQWGCWNTYYVDPVNNYLVQSLLFSGDKGAAAVFGAVTLTDSEAEQLLGQALMPRLTTPGTPMGKALQDAKSELAKTNPKLLDVLLGWTLMGDPALIVEP